MAANFYVVTFDPAVGSVSRDGVKSAIVVAESAADARAALKAQYGNDSDAGWANATVTAMAAGADLAGWTLHLDLIKPTAKADGSADVLVSVDVVGVAADTFDTIGAAAVTALNATVIGHAAYASNVLTVAGTLDGKGDHRLVAAFYPPGERKVAVPGFLGAVTHQGSSGAAVSVAFAADAYTIPKLTGKFKSRFA